MLHIWSILPSAKQNVPFYDLQIRKQKAVLGTEDSDFSQKQWFDIKKNVMTKP